MIPDPDTIAAMVQTALRRFDETKPRAQQKRAGLLGPSEIGFCRAKALHTMQGIPDSDSSMFWAAVLGTAVGEHVENALMKMFSTWLFQQPVTCTLPNGAQISGSADIIVPEWNAVLDIKTKDGFEWAKREPWSKNYLYQTWLYATGAAQAGLLDSTQPLHVGLIYLDRSGQIEKPHVVLRELDPLEQEITAWVDDVINARKYHPTDWDDLRDIPAPVCQQICGVFSVYRGALPMDNAEPITDPTLVAALDMYGEGLELEKQAKRVKEDARNLLKGVNGSTPKWTVRWVEVPASVVPGYERRGYTKMDVVPTKRRQP